MVSDPYFTAQDDCLRYRIVRNRSVRCDTIRVSINVEMLVSAAIQDNARVRSDITAALTHFIKDATWTLSTLRRDTGSVVGYEQIRVSAMAVTHARENGNLHNRAHQASRQGLVLSNPTVDYSLPNDMVDKAVRELRLETLKAIACDIQDYTGMTGRHWRLGDIEFGIRSDHGTTTKGAQRAMDYDALSDFSHEGASGGSECISLVTQVCLRSFKEDVGHDCYVK